MVNEFSFIKLNIVLLESLKGLCEHDTSYAEVWRSVCACNRSMQPPPPSFETRVSPERLAEFSTGREVSVDSERSNKPSRCRAKVEDLEVVPSSSFV